MRISRARTQKWKPSLLKVDLNNLYIYEGEKVPRLSSVHLIVDIAIKNLYHVRIRRARSRRLTPSETSMRFTYPLDRSSVTTTDRNCESYRYLWRRPTCSFRASTIQRSPSRRMDLLDHIPLVSRSTSCRNGWKRSSGASRPTTRWPDNPLPRIVELKTLCNKRAPLFDLQVLVKSTELDPRAYI